MHRLVPQFLLDPARQPTPHGVLEAACLIMDISGFTAVTETLMEHGKEGAEVLADLMAALFNPLVESVYERGGFIASFAGDAFTAVFLKTATDSGAERALATALAIQNHFARHGAHVTAYGAFELGAKVGLAVGEVEWGLLASDDHQRAAYYFKGEAIDACAWAEQQAAGGEIVLSPEAYAVLNEQVTIDASSEYFRVVTAQPREPDLAALSFVPETPAPADVARFFPSDLITSTVRGEFRQVVAVFINLYGDPSHTDLERVAREVFRLQAQYGGYLNKLDFGDKGGTLIMLWGAPMSYENDLARALNFVLDLCAFSPVRLRVGITSRLCYAGFTGAALREEYTCYGRGVNLAARQMMATHWGEIWLESEIAQRPEVFRAFVVQTRGAHQLKGFSEPQALHALLDLQRLPITVRFYRSPLLGRDRELAQMRQFARPVREGRCAGLLTLVGEPGLGKSRLAQEFAQLLVEETPRAYPLILVCQADEIARRPFNPIRYGLRDYFEQDPSELDAENRARFETRLTELITATPASPVRAELERTRAFLGTLIDLRWAEAQYQNLEGTLRLENTLAALTALLQAESQRQPVIILLEDLQWFDADSRAWLQRFLRACAQPVGALHFPIALIATSRDLPPRDLMDAAAHHRILELETLPGDAIGPLAVALLEAPASPELIALLADRAEGNPFFIEQILRYMKEQGQLLLAPDGSLLPGTQSVMIPADVRSVLVARLDQLTPEVKQVVQTAAVLGREFEVRVLKHMLPSSAQLREQLAEAEARGIWYSLGEHHYIFRHALLCDAAYDMQLLTRRRELHALASRALEAVYASDLGPHYSELAYHAEKSGQLAQAQTYLRLSGERALALSVLHEARKAFERALALTLTPNLSPEVQTSAPVHWGEGGSESAMLELKLGETYLRLGDLLAAQMHTATALASARQFEAEDTLAAALAQLGFIASEMGDYTRAETHLTEALPLARLLSSGDQTILAEVLFNLGNLNWRRGQLEAAKTYCLESLSVARAIDDTPHILLALNRLGVLWGLLGEPQEEQRLYQEVLALAQRHGYRERAMTALNNLGALADELGRPHEAEPYYDQALTLAREIGAQRSLALYLCNVSQTEIKLGKLAEARAHLHEGLTRAIQLGAQPWILLAVLFFARLAAAEGDLRRARALVQAAQQQPAYNRDHQRLVEMMLAEWGPASPPDILEWGAVVQELLEHHALPQKTEVAGSGLYF